MKARALALLVAVALATSGCALLVTRDRVAMAAGASTVETKDGDKLGGGQVSTSGAGIAIQFLQVAGAAFAAYLVHR